MKRIIALMAVAILVLVATHGHADVHHIKAALESAPGSSVTGSVNLVQMPHGGTNIVVVASGLEPGGTYSSFYYESSDCTEPADLFKTVTARSDGTVTIQGKIDDDLDEVGSVSIRLGEGYGTLLACADVHGGEKE
jgi:hypothetical protein